MPCGLVCTHGSLLAAPPTAAWVPVNTLQDPFLEGPFLALRCFKCPYFLDGTAMLGCPPWLPLSLLLYCEILRKEGSLFIFPVSLHSFSSTDHLEYSLGHLKQLWTFVNKPCRLKIHRETLYSRITGTSIKTHGGQILPCFRRAHHGTQLRRAAS